MPHCSDSYIPFDTGLGISLSFDLNTMILEDLSSSIVYQNLSVPIPEPNTALLLGLGLLGLALRRSR